MEVGRRMGSRRGNLTEPIIQALDAWIKKRVVNMETR